MSGQTGVILVAVVAVIYGIGFAVLPMSSWDEQTRTRYARWGSALIAVLAIAFIVIPAVLGGD